MYFLHILIFYTKQHNRTHKRIPIRRCYLLRVKPWFYPNKIRIQIPTFIVTFEYIFELLELGIL